jgi:hypothetical protein
MSGEADEAKTSIFEAEAKPTFHAETQSFLPNSAIMTLEGEQAMEVSGKELNPTTGSIFSYLLSERERGTVKGEEIVICVTWESPCIIGAIPGASGEPPSRHKRRASCSPASTPGVSTHLRT